MYFIMPPSNPKCKGWPDAEQPSETSMIKKKKKLTKDQSCVRSCTLTSVSSVPPKDVTPMCIDNEAASQPTSPSKVCELDSTDVSPLSTGGNVPKEIESSGSSDDDIPDNLDEDERTLCEWALSSVEFVLHTVKLTRQSPSKMEFRYVPTHQTGRNINAEWNENM